MIMNFMVSCVAIYAVFYFALVMYERFIKPLNITNKERMIYVAIATVIYPITIFVGIIYIISILGNKLKQQ